jgi:hypothetical protein
MNIAGLALAFLGAILIALSQLGPLEALWSVNFLRIEGQDERIERRVKFARIRARVGWTLIVLGFLLQLLAAIFQKPPEIFVLPIITL